MSFNFYYIRTDDFSAYAGGGQREVITRDNYEAYFVMYVDDELSAAERKAVEHFIQQHPDLEEELVMLQQSVLRADEHIVFEPKELLFKGSATPTIINEHNYQEYFVLYGDDELTNEEKENVEQFVYQHPKYHAEFELIQQAKLVPDNTLTFPDKTYLFRTEEDDSRVVAFPWWRFTAAAIALLVIGGTAWYISISVQTNNTEVASQDGKAKPTLKVIMPLPKDYANSPSVEDNIVVPYTEDPIVKTAIHSDQEAAQNSSTKKNISKPGNILLASHVPPTSKQFPEPSADNEKNFLVNPVDVAVGNSYERPVIKSAIIQQTIIETVALNAVAEKPDDETDHSPTYVLNTQINKTPLRGFFRKVSRVVDKVTNDDNGKGGIRIANLAIALK
jgi:tellurite resistance protein